MKRCNTWVCLLKNPPNFSSNFIIFMIYLQHTMLMRLWPRARTSSWVRLVSAPSCRAWSVRRLWSRSKVLRKCRVLKECSPSTEMRLWLRAEIDTGILIVRQDFTPFVCELFSCECICKYGASSNFVVIQEKMETIHKRTNFLSSLWRYVS